MSGREGSMVPSRGQNKEDVHDPIRLGSADCRPLRRTLTNDRLERVYARLDLDEDDVDTAIQAHIG